MLYCNYSAFWEKRVKRERKAWSPDRFYTFFQPVKREAPLATDSGKCVAFRLRDAEHLPLTQLISNINRETNEYRDLLFGTVFPDFCHEKTVQIVSFNFL